MDWTGYGDSTKTGDDKYVLASFRGDANLGWVVDLRTFLNLPELKYRDYLPKRQFVASNPRIQTNLNRGLSQAELTVVDVSSYVRFVYAELTDQGAEPFGDFDRSTLHRMAADNMLRDSPFSLRSDEMHGSFAASFDILRRGSIGGALQELSDFDPSKIRQRAGGKLRDVQVLAARAYSMLSPSEYRELRFLACEPGPRGGIGRNIERIKRIAHIFDTEHAKSLPLLNELVGQIAQASGIPRGLASALTSKLPVREASSTASDHIQAADFAAGWAGDLLVATNNDFRALARQVRWVTLNGVSIAGSEL